MTRSVLSILSSPPDLMPLQVFYGHRSLVFPEADNRKWTIMAAFESVLCRDTLSLAYGSFSAFYSGNGISRVKMAPPRLTLEWILTHSLKIYDHGPCSYLYTPYDFLFQVSTSIPY